MKIIAIDFDGTLCTEKFPEIGEPIPEMIELTKQLKKEGYKLILWTCREGYVLDNAVQWCKDRGLEFDAVNDNLPEIKAEWKANVRKIYCDLYIDDKCLNPVFGEVNLERIRSLCKNSERSKNTLS